MKDIAAIAKEVRADVKTAIEHGTLTIPPCIRVTVRVDRRGLVPSVNAYFTPADDTATDDVTGPDNVTTLSDAVKTAGRHILTMIKNRSDGTSYGEINCHGTVIAIMTPSQNG